MDECATATGRGTAVTTRTCRGTCRHFLLFVLSMLAGCGGDPADPARELVVDTTASGVVMAENLSRSPALDTALLELQLGGEAPGPELFGRIVGLESGAGGRVYVVDQQASELRAFDGSGAHLWTAGGPGGGPEDLGAPVGVVVAPSGELWIPELGNGRYSRFEPAGSFIGVVRRQVVGTLPLWQGRFDEEGMLTEGGVAVSSTGVTGGAAFRVGPDGAVMDTLRLPTVPTEHFDSPGASVLIRVPYQPEAVWAPAGDGLVWTARSSEYRVALHNFAEDTVRVVALRSEPEPVTAEEREQWEERLVEMAGEPIRRQLARIPDRKPHMTALAADGEGGLWVRLPGPATDQSSVFDRFDATGRHIGKVVVPERLGPLVLLRGDRLLATSETEAGVPTVVVYRVPARSSP